MLSRLSDNLRISLSVTSLSAWLVLLMIGQNLGGAVYLLLVTALVLFPWHLLR